MSSLGGLELQHVTRVSHSACNTILAPTDTAVPTSSSVPFLLPFAPDGAFSVEATLGEGLEPHWGNISWRE